MTIQHSPPLQSVLNISLIVLFLAASVTSNATPPPAEFTEQDMDAVWSNHLLWKNKQPSENTAYNESLLREALRLNPNDSRALLNLYNHYLNIGQITLARMAARYAQTCGLPAVQTPSAATQPPRIDSAKHRDAVQRAITMDQYSLYCSKGDYVRAEDTIREALPDSPDDPALLSRLGEIYLVSREVAMGAMLFGYLHALTPDDIEIANRYAFFLKALGRHQQALDLLCAAELNHPGHDMTLDNIISLAGNLNDQKIAGEYIEKWVRLSPNNPNAWMRKAHFTIYQNDLAAAKEAAQRARTLTENEKVPGPYVYLAEIAVRENQPDTAREWLEKLREIIPPSDFAAITAKPQFKTLLPQSGLPPKGD